MPSVSGCGRPQCPGSPQCQRPGLVSRPSVSEYSHSKDLRPIPNNHTPPTRLGQRTSREQVGVRDIPLSQAASIIGNGRSNLECRCSAIGCRRERQRPAAGDRRRSARRQPPGQQSVTSLKAEIGKEAERILESATYASETQFEYAKRWRRVDRWIGSVAAVLAAIAGVGGILSGVVSPKGRPDCPPGRREGGTRGDSAKQCLVVLLQLRRTSRATCMVIADSAQASARYFRVPKFGILVARGLGCN